MPDQKFPHLWSSATFWIVVIGAASFKAIKSPDHTWVSRLVSFVSAIFVAVAFTPGLVEYFEINGDGLKTAMAALVAITGEHLMTLAIVVARDPKAGLALWREWKSGGKS